MVKQTQIQNISLGSVHHQKHPPYYQEQLYHQLLQFFLDLSHQHIGESLNSVKKVSASSFRMALTHLMTGTQEMLICVQSAIYRLMNAWSQIIEQKTMT